MSRYKFPYEERKGTKYTEDRATKGIQKIAEVEKQLKTALKELNNIRLYMVYARRVEYGSRRKKKVIEKCT